MIQNVPREEEECDRKDVFFIFLFNCINHTISGLLLFIVSIFLYTLNCSYCLHNPQEKNGTQFLSIESS